MRTKLIIAIAMVAILLSSHQSARSQWVQTNGPYGGHAKAFTSLGNVLFVGTNSGVYRSNNEGLNWKLASEGLPNKEILNIVTVGTTLFVTIWDIVYGSNDSGRTWGIVRSFAGSGAIAMFASDSTLFVSTIGALYSSVNRGNTWSYIPLKNTVSFKSFCKDSNTIYALGSDSIYSTIDAGKT